MRRALSLAGARTQLMTLWTVSENQMPDVKSSWYQLLKDGADKAEVYGRCNCRSWIAECCRKPIHPSVCEL